MKKYKDTENNILMEFIYGKNRVRFFTIKEEFWFVAEDICRLLNIDMTRMRKEFGHTKYLYPYQTPKGIQVMMLINGTVLPGYFHERLSDNIYQKVKSFISCFDFSTIRSDEEINEAEEEFFQKVWYGRHIELHLDYLKGSDMEDPRSLPDALKFEENIVKKYGRENLGPWDAFKWGMDNGKLSALRWVQGDDWDNLDT